MRTDRGNRRRIVVAGVIVSVSCAGCGWKRAERSSPSPKPKAAMAKPPARTWGDARIDAGGAAKDGWRADCDYQGGAPVTTPAAIDTGMAAAPAPEAVMRSARQAARKLRYGFRGFAPGETVFLRLYFAEIVLRKPGQRIQTIFLNGAPVQRGFDIVAEAGKPAAEVVKEFSTQADARGSVLVTLSSAHGGVLVNALEARRTALAHFSASAGNRSAQFSWKPLPYARVVIQRRSSRGDVYKVIVPGESGGYQDAAKRPVNGVAYRYTLQAVDDAGGESEPVSVTLTPRIDQALRINVGGGASGTFAADQGFSQEPDGSESRKRVCWTGPVDTTAVMDPAPAPVYRTARFGKSLYFSVNTLAPNRDYTVRLHFTEDDPACCEIGKRIFSVYDSRRKVFDRVDIYGEAGAAHKVVVKEFPERVDATGSLALAITADGPTPQTEAKLDAVEIVPASPEPPGKGRPAAP
jgi:hypothetical protein